jgi:K+-transporting ATPase A subunit
VDLFSATQYLLFLAIVTALVKPLGGYMERVFSRKRTALDPLCLPIAAVVTSNTATGSYNSADDSYTSLGGMVLLVNMLLGELVFGGLGTGLYSMVMTAAVAVFLAGLMVGVRLNT